MESRPTFPLPEPPCPQLQLLALVFIEWISPSIFNLPPFIFKDCEAAFEELAKWLTWSSIFTTWVTHLFLLLFLLL